MKTQQKLDWLNCLLLTIVFLITGFIVHAQQSQPVKGLESSKRLNQELNQLVLFDNGPFISDSTGGPGNSAISLLQDITLDMNYPGFGAGIVQNKRIADDFVIPMRWRIRSIEFFVYQSGSSIDPTIDQMNVRIWNGVPGESGSEVVWGNAVSNIITTVDWTGCYRVTETYPTMTIRPVMKVVAELPAFTLDPGTYWIDAQFDGTLSSEPSVVPITIMGEQVTGNARQSISGNWYDIVDVAGQGVPFIIRGEEVVCDPPTSLIGFLEWIQGEYVSEICWNLASVGYMSEWFYYDDGVNVDGIGGQTSFSWAIKFDPEQLTDFDGASLTKIKIYNRSEIANELRIYEGTNATTLRHTQILNDLAVEAWSEVNLTDTIAIDITKQLWIVVSTEDGLQAPAACGNGMNEPNGDLIMLDGINWEHLSDYNHDYTWNLRCYVSTIAGESSMLPLGGIANVSEKKINSETVKNVSSNNFKNGSNSTIIKFNIYKSLEGYSDYTLYASLPVLDEQTYYCYVDTGFNCLYFHLYKVTAVWLDSMNQECESLPAKSLIFPDLDYVYVYCEGINDLEEKSVLVYPNPACESLTIESADISRVTMMNAVGQVVYDATTNNASKVTLNTVNYEAGVYVVRIQTSEGSVSKRVTIVR